jgi:hypothetical protein
MSRTVKSGRRAQSQGGYVKSSPSGQIQIPKGTTANRSQAPKRGMFRYNKSVERLEFYNGTTWQQIGGGTSGKATITADTYTGDGTTTVFGSGAASGDSTVEAPLSFTPAADQNLLVFIDGVFQPDTSYSVSGVAITFGSAPGGGTKIVVLHGFDSI